MKNGPGAGTADRRSVADLPFQTAAQGVLVSVAGYGENSSRRPVNRSLHWNRSKIANAWNARQPGRRRLGQKAERIGDIEDPMPRGVALGRRYVQERRSSLRCLVRE